MSEFRLIFPVSEIMHYAESYNYTDDNYVKNIGEKAKANGYLNRDDFLSLCYWKTPRSKNKCRLNSEDYIQEITQVAFSTNKDKLSIEILTLLNGVGWPTASAILHFCHTKKYPILDFRALYSLGVQVPKQYDYEFWRQYTQECRTISENLKIDMRTLDRALWQYSKENQ